MIRPRILILDSGVGGLSVFHEITRLMPSLDIDYLADHKFFPYGSKAPERLVARVSELIHGRLSQHCYQLVVIACNTASTVVLDALRSEFDIPFVGVVPAIKPACARSSNKRVGVLATEGTVTREYTHNLIRDFGSDSQITLVGSARLVELAEQKLSGISPSLTELAEILEPLKEAKVDQVVLGCTHFPLLKDELIQAADWQVSWVDSGQAIAQRVQSLLESDLAEFSMLDEAFDSARYAFYSTDVLSNGLSDQLQKLFHELRPI